MTASAAVGPSSGVSRGVTPAQPRPPRVRVHSGFPSASPGLWAPGKQQPWAAYTLLPIVPSSPVGGLGMSCSRAPCLKLARARPDPRQSLQGLQQPRGPWAEGGGTAVQGRTPTILPEWDGRSQMDMQPCPSALPVGWLPAQLGTRPSNPGFRRHRPGNLSLTRGSGRRLRQAQHCSPHPSPRPAAPHPGPRPAEASGRP